MIKELGVLEKMREADLCSTPSGQKAVNGGVSVEDAVKEIVKKVAIYLAE